MLKIYELYPLNYTGGVAYYYWELCSEKHSEHNITGVLEFDDDNYTLNPTDIYKCESNKGLRLLSFSELEHLMTLFESYFKQISYQMFYMVLSTSEDYDL